MRGRLRCGLICAAAVARIAGAQELRPQTANGCVESPAMVNWQDYSGPMQKLVGTVGRSLEHRAVHPPHYRAGTTLCSLELKEKFRLFVVDTLDPLPVFSAGFDAAIGQARNDDPSFGQGGAGYGRRFATGFAGQVSHRFFTEFAYPAIFSEDPRYYRMEHGGGRRRLWHAMEHTFVAQRDSGKRIFNSSEWLGTASSVVVNDTMHPDHDNGLGQVARDTGFAILGDMGFDVLREFWPEIAKKFKMPFRDRNESAAR